MKRTCSGCRALTPSSNTCSLGYKTETRYFGGTGGYILGAKPLEECPKPKTYQALHWEQHPQNKEVK